MKYQRIASALGARSYSSIDLQSGKKASTVSLETSHDSTARK